MIIKTEISHVKKHEWDICTSFKPLSNPSDTDGPIFSPF